MADNISHLVQEGQDEARVRKMFDRVSQIAMLGESIEYIAVQSSLATPNIAPDGLVLTNKRVIFYQPKMLGGVTFVDFPWRDLVDAQLVEGIMRSKISTRHVSGKVFALDNLPKPQARKAYVQLQQRESDMKEERRQRELEEKRAAAGGVFIQAPAQAGHTPTQPSTQQNDAVSRLRSLKDMLDNGLITQAEYDTKKSDILSRM